MMAEKMKEWRAKGEEVVQVAGGGRQENERR